MDQTNQENVDNGVKSDIKGDIKTVMISDQGANLPCGIGDGIPVKSFGIKPWRMKEERELGAQRDQQRGASIGQFVATVIANMCTNIGPYNFQTLKPAEKLVHISQMTIGDVFYAYTWLRIQSVGSELKLEIKCPSCGHKFKFTADLNTIETRTCNNYEDATWNHKLKNPFTIRGKEVTELKLGPARWITMENLKDIGSMDTGAAKSGLIIGSILAINNWPDENGKPTPVALAEIEIDEMSKFDLESITSEIDKHSIGPDMSVHGTCPKCHGNYVMPLNWSYDNFFGSSGR